MGVTRDGIREVQGGATANALACRPAIGTVRLVIERERPLNPPALRVWIDAARMDAALFTAWAERRFGCGARAVIDEAFAGERHRVVGAIVVTLDAVTREAVALALPAVVWKGGKSGAFHLDLDAAGAEDCLPWRAPTASAGCLAANQRPS